MSGNAPIGCPKPACYRCSLSHSSSNACVKRMWRPTRRQGAAHPSRPRTPSWAERRGDSLLRQREAAATAASFWHLLAGRPCSAPIGLLSLLRGTPPTRRTGTWPQRLQCAVAVANAGRHSLADPAGREPGRINLICAACPLDERHDDASASARSVRLQSIAHAMPITGMEFPRFDGHLIAGSVRARLEDRTGVKQSGSAALSAGFQA
jgi:hypothetical protein